MKELVKVADRSIYLTTSSYSLTQLWTLCFDSLMLYLWPVVRLKSAFTIYGIEKLGYWVWYCFWFLVSFSFSLECALSFLEVPERGLLIGVNNFFCIYVVIGGLARGGIFECFFEVAIDKKCFYLPISKLVSVSMESSCLSTLPTLILDLLLKFF